MKILSWLLILITLAMVGDVIEEHFSGHGIMRRKMSVREAYRDIEPEKFKEIIFAQWVRAIPPGVAGILILAWIRRHDRLDPMSPKFQGGKTMDELSDYLDEELRNR